MASQAVQLTGNLTGLGALAAKDVVAGSDIAADAVTFAKLQNVGGGRLLGRSAAGTGDVEEIQLGAGLSLASGVLTSAGAASLGYAAVVAKAASGPLAAADAFRLVAVTVAGITLTVDPAGFVAGQWLDLANLAAGTVTLAVGGGGAINKTGQTSVTVLPQQIVRLVFRGAVTPAWAADIGELTTVSDTGVGNAWILGRAGGGPAWRSPTQARADLGVPDRVVWLPLSIQDVANRTYALPFAPFAATVDALDYRRAGGLGSATITVQIADQDDANPTAVAGMSALAASTVRQTALGTGNRVLAASGAADRTILVVVANVTGTTPLRLDLALKLTRTA